MILNRIDVSLFRKQAEQKGSVLENAALVD
jgi:hypothetical protein